MTHLPKPRINHRLVSTVVVGSLLLGVNGFFAYNSHQSKVRFEEAETSNKVEVSEFLSLFERSEKAVESATKVLSESADKVADNAVRTELQAALAAMEEVPVSSGYLELPLTSEVLEENTKRLDAINLTTENLIDSLDAASKAVSQAQAAWEMTQAVAIFDQASLDLQASIDSANSVQTGSENKVADNGVRQVLEDTLVATAAIPLQSEFVTVQSVVDATASLTTAKATLDGATAAVSEAQVAWEAEAARLAEEARVAEARRVATEKAAAAKASKATTSKSSHKTATAPAAKAPAEGSPAAAAPAPSGKTLASVASAEASRFGVSVTWVTTTDVGGTGSFSPGAFSLYGAVLHGSTGSMQLSIGGADPNQSAPENYYNVVRDVVRHEAAHNAFNKICGTLNPSIVNGRMENVTDAYGTLFYGMGSASYGYNDSDADIARSVNSGQCS